MIRPTLAAGLALVAAAAAAAPIGTPRQLTFEGARAGEGYFSADGARMIFQSEREPGNPFYQMYVMDLGTGDVTRLSPGVGKTTCGWLHPDGERALYASTEFDPEAEAKMQAELDFRASGQTRRYSWDYDPSYDIVARPVAGGPATRLTTELGYDAEGAYSPDGSKIVFASNRAAYAATLSAEDAERLERDPAYFMDIYVMDADGGGVTRLTDAPGYDGGPFWSADGARIVWRRFSEDGASAEVFSMAADGSDERQLTDLGVMSWAPFMHPSGSYAVFATNLQGFANFELYIVDAAGAKVPQRVTDRAGFDGLATFTPDGARISWTSNATPAGVSQVFLADWDHAAALALLADAPARAADAPAAGEPDITIPDLRAHVRALTDPAMEGRLTGTEGERLATQYVAEAFFEMGLQPAGPDASYFDPFDFTAGVALGPDNALTVSLDGEAAALAPDADWRPMGFSAGGAAAEAPVAFAGFGLVTSGDALGIDSYEGLDVTGKWVLLWRGLPADLTPEEKAQAARFSDMRYKASVAKSKGAAGVIIAPPSRVAEGGLPRLAYEASDGSAALPVVAVDAAQGARMLSKVADLAERTARLEAGEAAGLDLIGVSAAATVDLAFQGRRGRNVVARLGVGDPSRPPLYIGAHVDHLGRGETSGSLAGEDEIGTIHPGADDNASGVAALLEAAQLLAALRDDGALNAARDVVFAAWSGEELGLLGSNAHVDGLIAAAGAEDLADAVSAYINLDMVGRLEDKVVVSGLGSSPIWAREVERRNAVVGLPIVTSQDSYLPTDSTAFYLAGVPILTLFTGAHGDYHRPADTADKLNYEGLRDIARFTALVARSRALDPEEPEHVVMARPASEGGRRMAGVFLGTIPDYAGEGVTGVPISGVVKGGPAEAAGLRGGDVIVGLAGQDLANIYDYVRALNGLTAGEATDVTVLREGEAVTLEVTPGLRE